jgi:hypothetical protein
MSSGDYTITIKYDLNDVQTKKNKSLLDLIFGGEGEEKKVDGSSINASIVGTTSGAGRISGHIKIFYSKGSEYMDASDLDNYFKKVENQIKLWEELKPAPPLPDRPEKFVKFQKEGFEKDKLVLTSANLTNYYFETEEDAVYAFGVVYGGRGQIIEYGAVVNKWADGYTLVTVKGESHSVSGARMEEAIRANRDTAVAMIHSHHATNSNFTIPPDGEDYGVGYKWDFINRLYLINPTVVKVKTYIKSGYLGRAFCLPVYIIPPFCVLALQLLGNYWKIIADFCSNEIAYTISFSALAYLLL